MRTRTFAANLALFGAALAALAVMLGAGAARAEADQVMAGAAKVDASWHVGASAGQYAGDCAADAVTEGVEQEDPQAGAEHACVFGVDPSHGTYDPTFHSYRRKKSYGLQSRLEVRALVVQEGLAGTPVAIAKTDLYIPQDLLYRRAAQLLESDQRFNSCGVGRATLTMATTHNHSSPMNSSTAWGVWAFQDVFDIRFYNYMAERIAEAVTEACRNMVPVRVGASVGSFDETHRHSFGPSLADDGTPAGYPNSETDHDMTVIRFDDAETGDPVANLVNFSLHPEFLEGNNLISADYIGPLERMTDRATGALTVWTQGAVGTAEPERSTYHSIHERLEFSHKDYAQAEYGASLMSRALVDIWDDIENVTPEDTSRFVPFGTDFSVDMDDRWYPGPLSHPYPGVSNCRTDPALAGDPQVPVVGLPDCTSLRESIDGIDRSIDEGFEEAGIPVNPPLSRDESPVDPGLDTDDFQAAGIPVPENYSAPSYTGLEEDINVHLQGIRLGEIYLPVCSCEQWFDQSKNIETRTDREAGNEWKGYDWGAECRPNNDGTYVPFGTPGEEGTGTWSCPNPGNPAQSLPPVSDHEYRRMRAQVLNPANGWNDPENVAAAESEPVETTEIKGNYTHDDDDASAARGYTLTVPISMANDYNGYIATYREYQRGDHYRKALTGWGPHASDYMATRLVTIGRQLKGMPDSELPADQKFERENLAAKVAADQEVNDARAEALGRVGTELIEQYEEGLPDDSGEARPIEQPAGEVERFGTAFFTWNGGSNYTDSPTVVVERKVGGDVWETFADQSGELPLTLEYPEGPDSAPSYLEGGQEWHWTTHFEAFVSPFNVGSEIATPEGTYRFAVQGERRSGGEEVGYEINSDEFEVKPWEGITADDVRVEPDGRVGFAVGPRTTHQVPADNDKPANGVTVNSDGPAVSDEIGPIDYPDSYSSSAPFVRELRTAYRDPAAPGDPDLLEWFCFTCSFRPWLDAGDAETAELTFVGESGETETVPAVREGDRWVSERSLAEGESAFVDRGDVLDPYGNLNGQPSALEPRRPSSRRRTSSRRTTSRRRRRTKGRRRRPASRLHLLERAGAGSGRSGKGRLQEGQPSRRADQRRREGRLPEGPWRQRQAEGRSRKRSAVRWPRQRRDRLRTRDRQRQLRVGQRHRAGRRPRRRQRLREAPRPRLMRRGRAIAVSLGASLAGLAAIAPAAPAAGDGIAIRTPDQGRALAADALNVRIAVSRAAPVALRASAPGVRRLTERGRIGLKAGAPRRVRLALTPAGRAALERASTRCESVSVRVRARVIRARGRKAAQRDKRSLGPDQSRCARPSGPPEALPAPGGGGGDAPPGGGAPGPGGGGGGGGLKLRAGAATADITPPVGTPMFAYTARSRIADPPQSFDEGMQLLADPAPDENLYAKSFEPSEGIHTRLRSSAIVIERDGERFALVQADLGGLPYQLVQAVEDRITETGIDSEHLILSATHTHSATGPIWPADNAGYAALGGDFFDPRVFKITADGIAEAIVAAAGDLQPARIGVGRTELRGASSNRASEAFGQNPEASSEEPINPELTVIRVDDRDGRPLGLWSNFAVHETSFSDDNLLFSGDNAATTERVVERKVASESGASGPAPGAPGNQGGPVLVWTNAAEGDVSPNGGSTNPDGLAGEPLEYTPTRAAGAHLAGLKVARGILAAWRDAGARMKGDLELDSRQTFTVFDGTPADGEPVGPETVLGAGGIAPDAPEGFPEYCLPAPGAPGQGRKFPLLGGVGLVPQTASISLWRLGDLAIASFPFEITTQMGRRIIGRVESDAGPRVDSAVLAGLTNGYLSYTATPQEYDACGYEGSFTLFGRQQGARLRDVAAALVPVLYDGQSPPLSGPEPAPLGLEAENQPASEPTPAAGDVVGQPADVRRYDRATFSWKGGDPSVDAPRGATFVSLQRFAAGDWGTIATEDGPEDTTAWDDEAGTWSETWQFSECDPLGTYRFVATGVAVTEEGGEPEPYTATSEEFTLGATPPLEIIDATVSGTTARVRARYPDPGPALLAVPRRVRDGSATISLAGGGEVEAEPDAERLAFEAPVPAGSVITGVQVTDRCGNTTG